MDLTFKQTRQYIIYATDPQTWKDEVEAVEEDHELFGTPKWQLWIESIQADIVNIITYARYDLTGKDAVEELDKWFEENIG